MDLKQVQCHVFIEQRTHSNIIHQNTVKCQDNNKMDVFFEKYIRYKMPLKSDGTGSRLLGLWNSAKDF